MRFELSELRKVRSAAGMSQKQVADRCGVSRSLYGQVEVNNLRPSAELMSRVCAVLKTSPRVVLGDWPRARSG